MLRFVSLVILAVWIGGLAVLGIVAAPSVFAVLEAHDPTGGRALAGLVFGAVFMRFQPVTWILGGLLIAIFAVRAALGPRPGRLAVRIWTVFVMVGISVGTTFLIIPRIDRIRNAAPGPIASLSDTDAARA